MQRQAKRLLKALRKRSQSTSLPLTFCVFLYSMLKQGFCLKDMQYSPDSAGIASKTAETFETLITEHSQLHFGFFLGLDTYTSTERGRKRECFITDSLAKANMVSNIFRSFTRIQSAYKMPVTIQYSHFQ